MHKAGKDGAHMPVDPMQQRLVDYARLLTYAALPEDAVHAAKMRIIDTLGSFMGGYYDEPSRIARELGAELACAPGATLIGTNMTTTPEMAAFVNAITGRSVEANDVTHKAGGRNGHPSDVIMPVLAAAEYVHASGRQFLTAVVLAYEVYLRVSEAMIAPTFDLSNFCSLATAVATGRLWGLDATQLAQCIAIVAVSNIALTQARTAPLTMWKAGASGEAGRAGIFAARIARRGMEGAHQPFEGKNGWCKHIAQKSISLERMGGPGVSFRVQDSIIKPRPSCFLTLTSILAAEKISVALGRRTDHVQHILVETYAQARNNCGADAHWWSPDSRESADHSIPYAVAVTLKDGTVTSHSFDADRLWDAEVRALLPKVEVVENLDFSAAYDLWPVQHRTRVTVTTIEGERVVGETGGEHGDLSEVWSKERIEAKFRDYAEPMLGAQRATALLALLWNLEQIDDVASIPPQCVVSRQQ
jgi:2-methylcitrate dehydratase